MTDESEDVEEGAELFVRAAGQAELLGQLFDLPRSGLEGAGVQVLIEGAVFGLDRKLSAHGLRLGLPCVGTLVRRAKFVLGLGQPVFEISPLRCRGRRAFLLGHRLGPRGFQLATQCVQALLIRLLLGLAIALPPVELIAQGADLGAQLAVAPDFQLGLLLDLAAMLLLGLRQRRLGRSAAGGQVVAFPGQALGPPPGRIRLMADPIQFRLEGSAVLVEPVPGRLVPLLPAARLDLMVLPLLGEPGLEFPDLLGQFVVAMGRRVGLLPGLVGRLGEPGDLGLRARCLLARGLGLLERGIPLSAQGLGLAAGPLDLLLEGPPVPVEPGLGGVESLLPALPLGFGSGLFSGMPLFGLPELGPKRLVPRLERLPIGLPPGAGLLERTGPVGVNFFEVIACLGQRSAQLI